MPLWKELSRRKVFRTAVAYAAVAWLLVQVVVSVEEPLRLPDWTDTLVIVLLGLGFVVAVVLAWIFEVTPDGIIRTKAATRHDEASRVPGWWGYVATAIVAGLIGAIGIRLFGTNDDRNWLLDEALPAVEAALDETDWQGAYRLLREAESRFPDSPEIQKLWSRVAWLASIESVPEGASVARRPYGASDGDWELLGVTPLTDTRIPYGLSTLRFELDGFQALYRNLGGAHLNWERLGESGADGVLVGLDRYQLDTTDSMPEDMVRVSGWTQVFGGNAHEMADFFIDRYEVTNAEYREFVLAGGYRQPALWDPVVVGGIEISWRQAMDTFVDSTSRPGPSTWQGGDFPPGEEDLPVTGVSWYEASAYARYAGRELPSSHHWQHALGLAEFPWLLPVSNFLSDGPRAVSDSRAMSYTGAFDMTGNVREWTASAVAGEYLILGGSFNDPYYVAAATDVAAPPGDRSNGNGIRLVLTQDAPELSRLATAPLESIQSAAFEAREPVDDDVFAAYSRVFDYGNRPLNASSESVEEERLWVRERVSLDAGYGTDRLIAYVYTPTTVTPPFQTIVYWPGWDTFRLDDPDLYLKKQLDFVLKSGRAVAFPIYKGTFERRIGNVRSRPPFNSAAYRDNAIDTVKDMRRTIDYLETRRDIDMRSLVYWGYSWGGVNGPVAIAQEPRFSAAVIQIGLLPTMPDYPEADPANALPRVQIPTLMFSGEFDGIVPVENARRYFELLGTQPGAKQHVIAIGGHFIPRDLLISESLSWLDDQIGSPRF